MKQGGGRFVTKETRNKTSKTQIYYLYYGILRVSLVTNRYGPVTSFVRISGLHMCCVCLKVYVCHEYIISNTLAFSTTEERYSEINS